MDNESADLRTVNRLYGEATERAFAAAAAADELDLSGLQAAQLHFQARADERDLTHQDLADHTGYSQELVTAALQPNGPIPIRVLAAIASAVDCRLELREPLTIDEQLQRLERSLQEHTKIDSRIARQVKRCQTPHSFRMLCALFGGTVEQPEDKTIEQIAFTFAMVGTMLENGDASAAESVLDQLVVPDHTQTGEIPALFRTRASRRVRAATPVFAVSLGPVRGHVVRSHEWTSTWER